MFANNYTMCSITQMKLKKNYNMKIDEKILELIEEEFGNWVIDKRSDTYYQIGKSNHFDGVILIRQNMGYEILITTFKNHFKLASIDEVKHHLKHLIMNVSELSMA